VSVNRRGMDARVVCTTFPPQLHLASAIQSHTENFGSSVVCTQCLPRMNKHPASDRKTPTERQSHAQPIMSLVYPRRSRIFYRGIENDNLVSVYRDSRVSCTISFSVMLPSRNYPQESAACRYMPSGIEIKPFPP
jgi:hypothetical protein